MKIRTKNIERYIIETFKKEISRQYLGCLFHEDSRYWLTILT